MKKNEEVIIKYLSGLMSDEEKLVFEKESEESSEINSAMLRVKESLSRFDLSDVDIDERYFVNLLPKIHEKVNSKDIPSLFRKIYYLIPTVAAAVIALMFLFQPNYPVVIDYKALADEVVNNMSNKEVAQKYFAEIDAEPSTINISENASSLSYLVPQEVEINYETASKYLNNSSIEEDNALRDLNETDLELIADNLNSINVNR
jgi:hypothetical protein